MTDVFSVRVQLIAPTEVRVRLIGPSRIRVSYPVIQGPEGPQGPPGDPGGPPGPQGPPGSVWRTGSGAPSNALGVDGDLYLDVDTGDIYQKSSGVYVLVGNIEGPPGADAVLAYAPPSSLVVGGSNQEGVDTDVARADHVHGLPAFGQVAGTFAEGSDPRFPTQAQKNALQGTVGTPGNANRYVTDQDPRLASGGGLSTANQGMVASVTTAAFDLACATPIAATPSSDGYCQVLINGVGYLLAGDRTRDLYFSADGGLTARALANIAAGDLLYQGSGLDFMLDAEDEISFLYVV